MKNQPVLERTLILVKPDGIARGLTGEILLRFERKGLNILQAQMIKPTLELAQSHYQEHNGNEPYYTQMVNAITCGPCLAVILEGEYTVKASRQIIGSQDPIHGSQIGTIRGDYGISAPFNLVHGSDSHPSANREIELWFGKEWLLPKSAADIAHELEVANYQAMKLAQKKAAIQEKKKMFGLGGAKGVPQIDWNSFAPPEVGPKVPKFAPELSPPKHIYDETTVAKDPYLAGITSYTSTEITPGTVYMIGSDEINATVSNAIMPFKNWSTIDNMKMDGISLAPPITAEEILAFVGEDEHKVDDQEES